MPNSIIVGFTVGIGITIAVYGAVALIVKADDAGAAMARTGRAGIAQVGRLLVIGMPQFLSVLSLLGTAAMLWVGGDIVLHGLAYYGLGALEYWIKGMAKAIGTGLPLSGFFIWIIGALGSGIIGVVLGAFTVPVVTYIVAPAVRAFRKPTAV